jgi:RNA polymerase sigma factor (sigma-70 family)
MQIRGKTYSGDALAQLSQREQEVLIQRWIEPRQPPFYTYKEVAARMHVTAERVRQIEAHALRKLDDYQKGQGDEHEDISR